MRFRTGVAAVLVGAAFVGTASADAPITNDQATALARAINLGAADLPDWTPEPHTRETRKDREATDKWLRCSGALRRDRALAEVYSPDFQSPGSESEDIFSGQVVTSRVAVQKNAALAQRDVAAITSRRGMKCALKYAISHGKGLRVRLTRLPDPAPGVSAQRVRLHASRDLGGFLIYGDVLWFTRGPAEIQLAVLSFDKPFATSERQRLLNVLITRAQQQIP